MLPVSINLTKKNIALVGEEKAAERRLGLLDEAGANVTVFAPNPIKELEQKADKRLEKNWPKTFENYDVAMFVDVEDSQAIAMAEQARKQGLWVNIEDRPEYCDFYFASTVRRGDLVLSIHTAGKSPSLSVKLRKWLEILFPPQWSERLDEMALARDEWKKQGASMSELKANSEALIEKKGWFKNWCQHCKEGMKLK